MTNMLRNPDLVLSVSILCVLLAACLSPAAVARPESNGAADAKPRQSPSAGPAFDIRTLKPLLRGTWAWKLPAKDANGTTDLFVSFDEEASVTASARLVEGEGLVVSPPFKAAAVTVLEDASTNIKSPERGTILVLPLPGIQINPARLLLKAVSQKKIECVDLTDTENPARANLVKTTDRSLHDIKGPQPSGAPAAAASESGPSDASSPGTTPEPARRPTLSVFQRLKKEQAERAASESTSPPPPATPASTTYIHKLENPSTPVSMFRRLKEEQAARTAESQAATTQSTPASPFEVLQRPSRRKPQSVYQRLKAEQAAKGPEPAAGAAQDKQEPVSVTPEKKEP